ncbi:MAG: hypothetical protein HKN42_08070 [Granulosicoccus sp.]|nr:hypothetical protein [Granulosicoccus sp.]
MKEFDQRLTNDGLAIFPAVIGREQLEQLRLDADIAYRKCRKIQEMNGVDFPRVAHHIIKSVWRDSSFYDLLDNLPLKEYIDDYMGGPYILNTISAIFNYQNAASELENRPHRDMRSYFPVRLSINVIIFLDDFTESNGSTLFLKGSHLKQDMPSDDEFFEGAEKMLGEAGSIALFNSDLVHSGGMNVTESTRRCIVYTLHRPFIKTQFDYSTLVEASDSDWLKQLLGYHSRTAKTLEEWYQPPEHRMYKAGQG